MVRQFVLIASVVGLFMYSGFAIQAASPQVMMAGVPQRADIGHLQQALSAAGATLTQVVISGWVVVDGPAARSQAATRLGWTTIPSVEAGSRELKVTQRDGQYYLSVRWLMSGETLSVWRVNYDKVLAALSQFHSSPSITVQLEGDTHSVDLTGLANKALDALGTTDRQVWSDPPAASVAGKTPVLPPSPLGVNVQFAARFDSVRQLTHVWVAWPALLQEY